MRSKQFGFAHAILFLLIFAGAMTLLSIQFIHRSTVNKAKSYGEYKIAIAKSSTEAGPFVRSYWLDFEWLQFSKAQEGDRIVVPKMKLTSASNSVMQITVESHEAKYSNPCAMIEPWNCDPPVLPKTSLELPKDFINHDNSLRLITTIGGVKSTYMLESKDYHLSLLDSNGKKVSSIPHYPDGVAVAHSSYQYPGEFKWGEGPSRKEMHDADDFCERYDTGSIVTRLRQYGVKIASDTYPGIEKIRPEEVLILTTVDHVYNGKGDMEALLAPPDDNNCILVLSGTYTRRSNSLIH